MFLPRNLSGESIQFIAAALGSLQYLNFGLIFGITPYYAKLYLSSTETSSNRGFEDEVLEVLWLSGFLPLGVAVGSLIFGALPKKIGPKIVLLFGGLLQLASWFCIQHIQASRLLNGAGFGAAFTVLPIFITEITKNANITARCIAFSELSLALGIFLARVFLLFLPTYLVSLGIAISMAFIFIFAFVQESPYYLRNKGNIVLMEKSLRWYRGIRHVDDRNKPEFLRESAQFMHEIQESHPMEVTSLPIAYKKKLGFFCFVLIACSLLSGIYYIISIFLYTFEGSNEVLIFPGAQLLGAFCATLFGVNINRKILLSLSGLVSGFFLTFLIFSAIWEYTSMPRYVALGIVSLYIFSTSFGLQPLAIIVTQELLPTKLRVRYTCIISTISWLLLFVVFASYQFFGLFFVLLILFTFVSSSFLIAIVAFAFIPDTKGKSSEEIQCDLGFAVAENIARPSTISDGRIQDNSYI